MTTLWNLQYQQLRQGTYHQRCCFRERIILQIENLQILQIVYIKSIQDIVIQIKYLNLQIAVELNLINLVTCSIEIVNLCWVAVNFHPAFLRYLTCVKGTFDRLVFLQLSNIDFKLFFAGTTIDADNLLFLCCSKNK